MCRYRRFFDFYLDKNCEVAHLRHSVTSFGLISLLIYFGTDPADPEKGNFECIEEDLT
jgi:hypothetical protein